MFAAKVLDERGQQLDVAQDVLQALEVNKWVFDGDTLEMMWNAQCICRCIDLTIESGNADMEVVQQAVQGVERILATAIKRSGWGPIGWREGSHG